MALPLPLSLQRELTSEHTPAAPAKRSGSRSFHATPVTAADLQLEAAPRRILPTMKGLTMRHRFICFLSVAAPAFSAFLSGRLLTNCSGIFRSYYEGGESPTPLPVITRILLAGASSGILVRAGEIAAIAIASIGFILVHRLAPDRAFRSVLILVLIAWSLEMAVLMSSLIAFASPLTIR